MPGKKLVADFKLRTTLKVTGMAFSRDGKYLIIIGGLPDFNITIYDRESKKFIITEDLKLKSHQDFISVSFNPRSKDEFCILTSQKAQFYKILPAFRFIDENEREDRDGESYGGDGENFIDAWRYKVEEFDTGSVPTADGDDG